MIEFEALAVAHVANTLMACDDVESKPVPTAGRVSGSNSVPGPPEPNAGEPTTARDLKAAVPSMVAVVPIALTVNNASRSNVALFCPVVAWSDIAPPLNTMTEPKRTSKVNVPVPATVLIRPFKVSLIIEPICNEPAGRVQIADSGRMLVAVVLLTSWGPSDDAAPIINGYEGNILTHLECAVSSIKGDLERIAISAVECN